MLVAIDKLEESSKRYSSLANKAERVSVADFDKEEFIENVPPQITRGNILGANENLAKRFEMLEAIKKEPVNFAFERAIGENDSVYSNFIELIRNAKQKVGRIAVKQGNRNLAFATGFMVSENLMLTNWHVFRTIEEVADSEIQFHYELNTSGNPGTALSFKLQSDKFYHSNEELDYCFVAVSPLDISGREKLSTIGYIYIDPTLGKLGNEREEALNIIHHPDGDYMQLSIRENLFVKITPTSIWYETDTAPGSSGSPVFNDQWQVVALHHMGVGKKNDAGEYIDKNGKEIPKINGKIDASKVVWEANEGIRISVILKDVLTRFPNVQIIKGLQNMPKGESTLNEKKPESETEANNTNLKESGVNLNNDSRNFNISFPTTFLEKTGTLNININQGSSDSLFWKKEKTSSNDLDKDLEFAEIKKLEESTDYSLCKGYQSRFLGSKLEIPLPQPQKSIHKFIAKIGGTDGIVLKYFNYSTIFHSVRMMPILSAINVHGDPTKRQDYTERKDTWLRDTRLSFDIQLGDTYYKNSGFDRGHMSRREDANWGNTAEFAKRNADFTCMYTNACPQVAKLNQSSKKGLWGKLEKIVLETGAENEKGRTAKISVLNGPIFKDNDPVFRGIQVPLEFYKIILWLTNSGQLKATAFKLAQTNLVSNIDFEQIDIDQNVEFQQYQCSIKSLQSSTKLDFSNLIPLDTYKGNGEVALNSELEVQSLILAHIGKTN